MTDVVEERGRLGIKAAIDGDPKDAIKFDIREDEEQNVKLQETVELLVVAGYFRARIKGLAAFDKVVGGMVWCISLCNIDVDVDLLYQENSTIGQKIALTERIVKVLPKMKCPHMIEPHQIQGLDFIHIFPVVQWLVKMALEAKQQMGDHVQALAASQFDSRYSLPEEQVRCKAVNKSVAVQQSIRSSGGPKRLYKKPADLQISEEDRRVHTTLLEYGWRHTNLLRSTETGETSARNAIGKPSDAQDDIDLSSLISGLSVVADSETKMSASYVASLMDNSKIKQMATKYAQKDVEPLSPSKLSSKSYSLAFDQHQTKTSTIEDLELEIENARTKMAELLNEEQNLAEAVDEEKLALEKEKLSDEEVDAEIHRISELEAKIERETATKLRELMVEHDDIRQKEKEFKDRCLSLGLHIMSTGPPPEEDSSQKGSKRQKDNRQKDKKRPKDTSKGAKRPIDISQKDSKVMKDAYQKGSKRLKDISQKGSSRQKDTLQKGSKRQKDTLQKGSKRQKDKKRPKDTSKGAKRPIDISQKDSKVMKDAYQKGSKRLKDTSQKGSSRQKDTLQKGSKRQKDTLQKGSKRHKVSSQTGPEPRSKSPIGKSPSEAKTPDSSSYLKSVCATQFFKSKYELEFAALEAEIERLKSQDLPAGLDKNARRQEIETEFKREKTKLHQSRLALAQLNRQVASLQRRIDEVPSQAELNQYQKRFIELYNQVASKHRETKQFYTLHNTLLDMKAYMKREIDLLDNIYNVQNMATQEGYKMSFVRNLEQILDGVRQNKLKVERKQTEERLRRDMLRENYQEMLDKQRLYYKTVKDFQEECKKNELLHERLKEVGTD